MFTLQWRELHLHSFKSVNTQDQGRTNGCSVPQKVLARGYRVLCVVLQPGTANLNPETRECWKDGGPAPGARSLKRCGETRGWGNRRKCARHSADHCRRHHGHTGREPYPCSWGEAPGLAHSLIWFRKSMCAHTYLHALICWSLGGER